MSYEPPNIPLGRRCRFGGISPSPSISLSRAASAKPINPSTTKTAPATINQCAYCIAEPPSCSSFLHLEPELDQAANYHFALSFLTSLSSHPRKRSDPSRAYSCESRALQKGRTYRHAYRLPWPQARRRGRQLLRWDELLISRLARVRPGVELLPKA